MTPTEQLQRSDPAVRGEVERRIAARTGGRVRELRVEVGEGWVVLRGRAGTYHVKHLAQQAAREALPGTRLENGITVG